MAWLLMVMPRSRSMSMVSRIWSRNCRSSTMPVAWISRSARVDLPWSIWAMMLKLRILGIYFRSKFPIASRVIYYCTFSWGGRLLPGDFCHPERREVSRLGNIGFLALRDFGTAWKGCATKKTRFLGAALPQNYLRESFFHNSDIWQPFYINDIISKSFRAAEMISLRLLSEFEPGASKPKKF